MDYNIYMYYLNLIYIIYIFKFVRKLYRNIDKNQNIIRKLINQKEIASYLIILFIQYILFYII